MQESGHICSPVARISEPGRNVFAMYLNFGMLGLTVLFKWSE